MPLLTMVETLTSRDTHQLLQALQELYQLHDLETFGIEAITIINRLVPSEIPEFHLTDFRSQTISRSILPGSLNFTPDMDQVIRSHWKEHPIVQNMPLTLTGAYKISDFMTSQQLRQLEGLYQQYLRVIGCEDQMVMFLPTIASQNGNHSFQANLSMAGIALNRSQCNFTERDRLMLNLLRPHLAQAYHNAQHHQKLQQQFDQLRQSLNQVGMIGIDRAGKIHLITDRASQILQTYFESTTQFDQLPELLYSWARYQITKLEQHDQISNGNLPLRLEQTNQQLVVRLFIEQPRERYLLHLEEEMLAGSESLELLGLTQREAEVLNWVIRGKDNQAIAQQLTIHISTVRKHLESIYRKLSVQSRTEAIAQTLNKLGYLNLTQV
ncbi:MAG: LuxR C-terminal-related transcriptional regulator [Synechococcales bacterium]|nr:LuxR C-terminal-related transcriptional regulator [Synechococcales bacterium]